MQRPSSTLPALAKRIAFSLTYVLVAVMAAATFIEKPLGHAALADHVYGAWWFAVLWAALAVSALLFFLSRRRPLHSVVLHLSFVVILLGALTTSLTATRGQLHLRVGQSARSFQIDGPGAPRYAALPATVELTDFDVVRHAGTQAPADYVSHLTVRYADGRAERAAVSMNKVYRCGPARLYQMSYDADGRGSYLQVGVDRWGRPLTYAGYALLLVGLVWMLLAPRGKFRTLLRHPLLRRGLLGLALLLTGTATTLAAPTLPAGEAERFGRLLVVYGDRVCPVQTLARDFTAKLHGSPRYAGYSAEQVLLGWLFWDSEWSREPIVRVKSAELRRALQLPAYAAFSDFFSPTAGYRLAPYVEAYWQGRRDALTKAAADLDDRLQLLVGLRQGLTLRMFPLTDADGTLHWYAPTESLPATADTLHRAFVGRVFNELYASALSGDHVRTDRLLAAIDTFQQRGGGASLPTPRALRAERTYNALQLPVWLSRTNLTLGLLSLGALVVALVRRRGLPHGRAVHRTGVALQAAGFATLTFYLALRMEVSGRIPLGNGYETMLALAWLTLLLALLLVRRLRLLMPFGFLLSGFFLLVSSLSQMNPQITPLVPVLSSPLLSVHVSLVMAAYALLAFTFLTAVTALTLVAARGGTRALGVADQTEALRRVSQLFLLPGLAFLGAGIFVGAVWADQSWGRYWGWDPKEVWALISFLIYAVAAHDDSLRPLKHPVVYHAYMILAFLSVVMTYWGVNYFLGGLHSYA